MRTPESTKKTSTPREPPEHADVNPNTRRARQCGGGARLTVAGWPVRPTTAVASDLGRFNCPLKPSGLPYG